MADELIDGLREWYGFDRFRPLQREVIEHLRVGGDALVLMPTGGGKSLCYQLPALLGTGLTLVVSPLIALMQDQVRALRANGAAADVLNSTLTPQEAFQVEQRVRHGQTRLLYAAPERLNTDAFSLLLESLPLELIAIDEAHCISQWGHQFRPDYRQLAQLTNRFAETPVAALTATATERVAEDIVDQLGRPAMRTFRSSYNRPNLTYRVVPKQNSAQRLVRLLQRDRDAATVVYVLKRADTEKIAESLQAAGIDAVAYHAGLSGEVRSEVQDRFDRGEAPVICATVAFGMGVDKPDIRRVIHMDMPESIETYYQETGRAGRDGDPAECLLFYTPGVWHQRKYFIDQVENDGERRRAVQRLRQMMDYCELKTCRRGVLLRYFGDTPTADQCGGCDNCLGGGDPTEAQPHEAPLRPERRVIGPNADSGSAGAAVGAPPTVSQLTEAERERFECLRAARRELARVEGLPAYVIAHDSALRALAHAYPQSLSEMEEVRGFGPAKVERYGEELLSAIGVSIVSDGQLSLSPPTDSPQTLTLVPASMPAVGGAAAASWEITLGLWREGCTVLAIAERRMLGPTTIVSHLGTALKQGEEIDLSEELPSVRRLGEIADALMEAEKVGVAHERLGSRYSMLEIRLVRLHLDSLQA